MKITFDPNKDAINIEKHGISLAEAENFEWGSAISWPDIRRDYGEARMAALGYIDVRLYFMAFVNRDGIIRVISLRKANKREINRYAQT